MRYILARSSSGGFHMNVGGFFPVLKAPPSLSCQSVCIPASARLSCAAVRQARLSSGRTCSTAPVSSVLSSPWCGCVPSSSGRWAFIGLSSQRPLREGVGCLSGVKPCVRASVWGLAVGGWCSLSAVCAAVVLCCPACLGQMRNPFRICLLCLWLSGSYRAYRVRCDCQAVSSCVSLRPRGGP